MCCCRVGQSWLKLSPLLLPSACLEWQRVATLQSKLIEGHQMDPKIAPVCTLEKHGRQVKSPNLQGFKLESLNQCTGPLDGRIQTVCLSLRTLSASKHSYYGCCNLFRGLLTPPKLNQPVWLKRGFREGSCGCLKRRATIQSFVGCLLMKRTKYAFRLCQISLAHHAS